MDTDDLTRETYKAIILTAEKFRHDLTLQFGVLAYSCFNDNEFLDVCKDLINEWEIEEAIMEVFFDDPPDEKSFKKILNNILSNIEKVKLISIENRKFDRW